MAFDQGVARDNSSVMLQAVWNEKIYAHFRGCICSNEGKTHAPNMMGNETFFFSTCQAGIRYDEDVTSVPLIDGDLVVIDHCK